LVPLAAEITMLAYVRLLDAVLSALLLALAQGQVQLPEPRTLIAEAAKACERVRTATYAANYRWDRPGGADPIVFGGKASFAKWDKDPGAGGAVPATTIKGKSRLGASVRIDLTDGRCFAYDGSQAFVVDPEKKKLLTFAVEDFADRNPVEANIYGNIAGALVQTALLDPKKLTDLLEPPSELSYEGMEECAGVQCHVILRKHPGDEATSDLQDRWFLGVEDKLPRRVVSKSNRLGEPQATVLELSELRINGKLSETSFVVDAPEGFETEEVKPKPRPELLPVGSDAPLWTLQTPSGDPVSLESLRGSVVVLDFWGTWCVPCIKGMPGIQKVHERFEKEGVKVFGVSCREGAKADPAAVMKRLGLSYGLLLQGDKLAEDYHVTGYPTLYIIDEKGKILYAFDGYVEIMDELIISKIEKHLQKQR
jgi:peroxiredoxin